MPAQQPRIIFLGLKECTLCKVIVLFFDFFGLEELDLEDHGIMTVACRAHALQVLAKFMTAFPGCLPDPEPQRIRSIIANAGIPLLLSHADCFSVLQKHEGEEHVPDAMAIAEMLRKIRG